MTISEIVAVIGLCITLAAIVGTIIVNYLRTKFMRIEDCIEIRKGCNSSVCQKIDELKTELTQYREKREVKDDNLAAALTDIWRAISRFEGRLPQYPTQNEWESLNGGTGRGFGGSSPRQKGE